MFLFLLSLFYEREGFFISIQKNFKDRKIASLKYTPTAMPTITSWLPEGNIQICELQNCSKPNSHFNYSLIQRNISTFASNLNLLNVTCPWAVLWRNWDLIFYLNSRIVLAKLAFVSLPMILYEDNLQIYQNLDFQNIFVAGSEIC